MFLTVVVVGVFVAGVLLGKDVAPAPPKPLDAWTAADVAVWVRGLGPAYNCYAVEFERNGVNGRALRALSPSGLAELGVKCDIHKDVITSNRAALH